MNYILLAIPFFGFLILLELTIDLVKKTGYYRINDAITSISAGTLSRVNGVFRKLIPLTIYVFVESNYALVEFEKSAVLWIFAFVLYDLCYYAFHRYSHEINILWAAHVVHHSSEEYNLSTALRQSSGSILGWIFYVPMALLGIDPIMLITVGSLNLLYQFWVHTRFIPKLGFYEWIFVTPSNHRVHHATNQLYLDRNYGGVFIIWDRIFNSFQEELADEPCIYGIGTPLRSWNPIWSNLHFYGQLLKDAWHTKNWRDKLLIWFKPTGWRPADMQQQYPLEKYDQQNFKKFDINITRFNRFYCLAQHIIILVGTLLFLQNIQHLTAAQQLLAGSFLILSSYSVSMILEGRAWSVFLEYGRYALLLFFAYEQAMPENILMFCIAIAAVSSLLAYFIKPVLHTELES